MLVLLNFAVSSLDFGFILTSDDKVILYIFILISFEDFQGEARLGFSLGKFQFCPASPDLVYIHLPIEFFYYLYRYMYISFNEHFKYFVKIFK